MKREYSPIEKQNHIYRLLGNSDPHIKNKFQYDDVAINSITHLNIADDISANIQRIINESANKPQQIRILDVFSCVGGNAISFCRHGFVLTGIELNDARFKMLEDNLFLFDYLPLLYNGDAYEIIPRLIQTSESRAYDVAFIDAPWDVRVGNTIMIGDKSLNDYITLVNAHLIVLKLPCDYDLGEYTEQIILVEVYDEPTPMMVVYMKK
jgi:16S rRNA G966 N2-methylase RsmD